MIVQEEYLGGKGVVATRWEVAYPSYRPGWKGWAYGVGIHDCFGLVGIITRAVGCVEYYPRLLPLYAEKN